jgi:hypothetical protein
MGLGSATILTLVFALGSSVALHVSPVSAADGTSATLSADWLDRAEKASEAESTIEFALSWGVNP